MIPYPCSHTLVIPKGDLFDIKVEQASPLYLGEILQLLKPGALMTTKRTDAGLQVDITGLGGSSAADAVVALTPKTTSDEATEFFSKNNRAKAKSDALEFLRNSPANTQTVLQPQ